MPTQDDQTARVMDEDAGVTASEAGAVVDDMQAVLKLIAAQLQDSDRRQSEVLADMHRRIAEMSSEARHTSTKVPAAFAPAFERIQYGLEQLADLVASAEANAHAETDELPTAEPAHRPAQATERDDPIGDRSRQAVGHDAPVSSMFPAVHGPMDFDDQGDEASDSAEHDEASAEDLMITDNAADRLEIIGNSGDPLPVSSHESSVESHAHGFAQAHTQAQSQSQARVEPPVFADQDIDDDVHADVDENWDELAPWNSAQAEALTRVYEAHDAEDAARAAGAAHHGMSYSAMFANSQESRNEDFEHAAEAPVAAAAGEEDDAMFKQDREPQPSQVTSAVAFAPVIEQAWLEERFAEIAAKIEESVFELRDDQALVSLSDRFGEFEERVGLALEDVATRHDVDALKSAEAQIDSMVGYFERVEAQLGRIDSLEGQMEALLDRFSDENLMQHFAGQGASAEHDFSGIAEAAAESVAQRFLADISNNVPGGAGETAAIGEMREALEVFMTERRERDDEAVGMLDTIQQALIRVLDRVEVLESAYENPPMASPLDSGSAPAGEADDDFAPAEASVQRRRPEADYSQTRLEYPAAVRDHARTEEVPQTAPQLDVAPGDGAHDHAVEAFDDDAFSDPALPLAQDDGFDAPAEHGAHDPATLDAGHETGAQSGPRPEAMPEWEAEASPQQPVSPIDRLRQEFIADARRAREQAAQQALLAETEAKEEPAKKKKLSVPGLSSLGAKVRGTAKSAQPANEQAASGRAKVVAGDDAAPSRSRFALPRSKILVGAVIVLFAAAGALLMMRSPSQPIADAGQPPAIQQSLEKGTSGPELSGPEEAAPEKKAVKNTDRQGSLDSGRIYDGEFNYDGPGVTEGRPFAEGLPGVAVAELDKEPNPEAVARAQRQQRLAKMSSDLGAAAVYATPAALMPDQLAAKGSAENHSTISRTTDGNHLDLPPATVGPLSLRLAAAKGDPSAQFEVAARLAGGTGTQQDLKGAVKWYQLAAAQGFAQAQYRLGTLYERGLGVEKDLARAGVWYERAANKGNVKAMHNLAVVSAGREIGGPDYQAAAKWFEAAAQYGLSDSQFNMAVLYENGLGIEKDLQQAYVYYALASSKGDDQAKVRLAAVGKTLADEDREAAERRVNDFQPKRADRLVNDARVAGEDWKKRADHAY